MPREGRSQHISPAQLERVSMTLDTVFERRPAPLSPKPAEAAHVGQRRQTSTRPSSLHLACTADEMTSRGIVRLREVRGLAPSSVNVSYPVRICLRLQQRPVQEITIEGEGRARPDLATIAALDEYVRIAPSNTR